jgi:hypothetical protein
LFPPYVRNYVYIGVIVTVDVSVDLRKGKSPNSRKVNMQIALLATLVVVLLGAVRQDPFFH